MVDHLTMTGGELRVTGGTIKRTGSVQGSLYIHGGDFPGGLNFSRGDLRVKSGTVNNLTMHEASALIEDGSFPGVMHVSRGEVRITGGTVHQLNVSSGKAIVEGGSFLGPIRVSFWNAELHVRGSGLRIVAGDRRPVLTGTLADGSAINVPLDVSSGAVFIENKLSRDELKVPNRPPPRGSATPLLLVFLAPILCVAVLIRPRRRAAASARPPAAPLRPWVAFSLGIATTLAVLLAALLIHSARSFLAKPSYGGVSTRFVRPLDPAHWTVFVTAGVLIVLAALAVWKRQKLLFVAAVSLVLYALMTFVWVRSYQINEQLLTRFCTHIGDQLVTSSLHLNWVSGGLHLSRNTYRQPFDQKSLDSWTRMPRFAWHSYNGHLGYPTHRDSQPNRPPSTLWSRLGFEFHHDVNMRRDWESKRLSATVPIWFVQMVLSLPLLLWAGRFRRRRTRRLAGLCASCGYDLRASTGRCPECGAVIPDLNVAGDSAS